MNEQDIRRYLHEHPDFFARHLDLLDILTVPHARKGDLSLVAMRLEQQRQQIYALNALLDKYHQLAVQESDLFLALMPLQQKLYQARHFSQGIAKLRQWAAGYELQGAKILLFTDSWQKNAEVDAQFWLDRHALDIIRLERFGLRQFYLGTLTHKEQSLLFLPDELPVGAVACGKLGGIAAAPTALLLFSAHDSDRFHAGQDINFLKHLAEILSLHLDRWLFAAKTA